MGRPLEIYLDIETDWSRQLTVLGFLSSATGLVQLVGAEITRRRLGRVLPKRGRLHTFNGHSFDLPVIRAQLGLDLRSRYDSVDLRWVCFHRGLAGGQKAIEASILFERETVGLGGMEAIELWNQHARGDPNALPTLLNYNAEDLEGMRAIKRYLASRSQPPRRRP